MSSLEVSTELSSADLRYCPPFFPFQRIGQSYRSLKTAVLPAYRSTWHCTSQNFPSPPQRCCLAHCQVSSRSTVTVVFPFSWYRILKRVLS